MGTLRVLFNQVIDEQKITLQYSSISEGKRQKRKEMHLDWQVYTRRNGRKRTFYLSETWNIAMPRNKEWRQPNIGKTSNGARITTLKLNPNTEYSRYSNDSNQSVYILWTCSPFSFWASINTYGLLVLEIRRQETWQINWTAKVTNTPVNWGKSGKLGIMLHCLFKNPNFIIFASLPQIYIRAILLQNNGWKYRYKHFFTNRK